MITLENNTIKSDNLSLNISSIRKVELKIVPVKKEVSKTIFNSLANTLSHSMANGDEHVQIIIRLTWDDDSVKDLTWNEETLVRNNLDYHKAIKEARIRSAQSPFIFIYSSISLYKYLTCMLDLHFFKLLSRSDIYFFDSFSHL